MPHPPPPLVERRVRSMGTEVTVLAPPDHLDAHEMAFEVIGAWDAQFSRFRPESELSALNRASGTPFTASDWLFDTVQTAVAAARATGGLFDPLLAGRMSELGYDRTFDDLPVSRQPAPMALWCPSRWREIVFDPEHHTICLPAGSGVDLGGIAKGMAVDAALARLVAAGVEYTAVNAGGDLAVHGLPPGFAAWPILVQGADDRVVTLAEGALATSSVMHRRWRMGREERHHLVDPRSGFPSTSDVVSASVAARSCAQAEVAAKAALLAGRTAGADFIIKERLAGLLLAADGSRWPIGRWSDS